jgi:hypothetical protein
MKYIKTYEGLFDFFRKKSEDDKIALDFIKRLKRVKGISPYPLSYNPQGTDDDSEMIRYRVIFDDTPIRIGRYSVTNPRITRGWSEETQKGWIEQGAVKKNNKVFYALIIETTDDHEGVLASWNILEELFDLTEKVFKENKTAMRIKKIRDEMNPAADVLNKDLDDESDPIDESINEKEVVFTNKRNPRLEIIVTKSPDGRIVNIENVTGMRFPFSVGQILNRTAEVWACNNNFLMDGKDTCPEKKIFGVRAKDVPQGHEWRHIFPNKFR